MICRLASRVWSICLTPCICETDDGMSQIQLAPGRPSTELRSLRTNRRRRGILSWCCSTAGSRDLECSSSWNSVRSAGKTREGHLPTKCGKRCRKPGRSLKRFCGDPQSSVQDVEARDPVKLYCRLKAMCVQSSRHSNLVSFGSAVKRKLVESAL